MVSVETILIGVAIFLLLPAGFLVGRFLDPDWRCVQLRRFLKRNYIVLNVVEGDGRAYITRVVNAENDVVMVDNYCWVITKGRIYRKDKQNIGTTVGKKDVRWGNQGAPNVFVTKDDIKPLPLDDPSKSNVKPDEIGSALNAWNSNEKAKMLQADKNAKLIQWITLGLLVIAVLLAFGAWDNSGKLLDKVQKGEAQIVPAGGGAGTVQGGSVVINQDKKGGVSGGG